MDDEQTAAVGSILTLAVRASISVHNYKNAIFLAERLVVEGTPHTYIYGCCSSPGGVFSFPCTMYRESMVNSSRQRSTQ
jgi:hypothetical protein